MLGRDVMNSPVLNDSPGNERYKRDLFDDLKIAIDLLKSFDDSLKKLHPEVLYKIRQIM